MATILPAPLHTPTGVALLSLTALSSAYLLYRTLSPSHPQKRIHLRASLPSPLSTLTPADAQASPYPPDLFPGARDVVSPYGSLRVYEWGPEEGKRVLLVHGIGTPCLSLGGVAEGLVEAGCRVMMLDLPGRGYSTTPSSLPQDTRLFTSALLIAISSSPLAWPSFGLVGYSLGGGIGASFASYFPHLVSDLVLLAPAGLIRPERLSAVDAFLYGSGLVPERVVEWVVRSRLKKGSSGATAVKPKAEVGPSDAVVAEVGGEVEGEGGFDAADLGRGGREFNVAQAVTWQVDNHPGFIKAFISSIRFGPLTREHEDWRALGQLMTSQRIGKHSVKKPDDSSLHEVLIICGTKDPFITPEDLAVDAKDALGSENVVFETLDAGHELPITKANDVVQLIARHWRL